MKFKMTILGMMALGMGTLFALEKDLQAEPAYVMNFGTVAPDGTPWADQLRNIKKKIERKIKWKDSSQTLLGGSLGSEIEMIQDVQRGERLQGGGFSTGAVI